MSFAAASTRPAIAAAHIFVLPSYNEGLPMVLLEAMASRLAVVATRVGAIPELVGEAGGNESGILVPAGDVGALATALRALCGDRERVRRMGQRGRETVESRYSARAMAERYRAVYEQAREDAKRRRRA